MIIAYFFIIAPSAKKQKSKDGIFNIMMIVIFDASPVDKTKGVVEFEKDIENAINGINDSGVTCGVTYNVFLVDAPEEESEETDDIDGINATM